MCFLLQRLYFQNQHYAQIYEKSNDLRKRFAFIFKAVTETMREELMIQKKDMNLTELKQYGKGTSGDSQSDISFIKNNFNDLSETAINLATLSIENSTLYYQIVEEIENMFTEDFFKHVSYMMTILQHKLKAIVEKAVKSLESATDSLKACQNEEEICQEPLKEALKFVFLPYEINKFPYETLGFGTYMAYFSKLLVKENSKFLVKKDLSEEEEWVRSFQAKVLGSLSSLDVGKMSLMEMVQILHRNNFKGYNDYGKMLQSLRKEMDCEICFCKVEKSYQRGEVFCKR